MSDLTVSQVAKELHVRRDAVVAFLKSGELEGYDVTAPFARRKSYRITRDALDAFKLRRSAKAPPQRSTQYRQQKTAIVREYF